MITITASAEQPNQFDAALSDRKVSLVYADSGYFSPGAYAACVKKAHEAGIQCGLRLPAIWRRRASDYFMQHAAEVLDAGFDIYLFRNIEGLIWFKKHDLLAGGQAYALDHSIYVWNSGSLLMIYDMLEEAGIRGQLKYISLPLELSINELSAIDTQGICTEITVYGRIPMMISAQCVKKNVSGCDKKTKILKLKDRTGALMPVKNCCRFCINTIYNSVPTAIYDMEEEIKKLSPSSLRYEFTDESPDDIKMVLAGSMPSKYTRAYARKGAM